MKTYMLATEDRDLGLVPARTAMAEAKKIANETGETVYVRDVITDQVMATVRPRRK